MKFLEKSDPKNKALSSIQAVKFLKYIVRVKACSSLNETSTLVFAKLATFHSL